MSGKGWIGLGLAAGVILLLAVVKAPLTTPQQKPSGTTPDKLVCLDCHRQANIHTNEGVATSRQFCNQCHEKEDTRRMVDGTAVSLQVPAASFADSPHRFDACIHCHTDVARSPHRTETGAQCRGCHSVHGEGDARSPHLRVDCQACHFPSEFVRMDKAAGRVRLDRRDDRGRPIALVTHGLADVSSESSCGRCHHAENTVGAPASVLPAKSALCVLCHPSALTVGHPIFWAALLVLVAGLLLMLRFWFLGRVQGEEHALHRKISLSADALWLTLFSRRFFTAARVLILDIVLQRRILKESVQRWSMHSLIFLAILARLGLSLFTGLVFAFHPDGDLALALIDKNHPFTAFVYDFLGLCILLGVLWAAVQRFWVRPAHVKTEIEDNVALWLVGALALAGFLTTGARLLLTGVPAETAVHSFIGYPVSRVLSTLPVDWRSAYPVLWYVHALLGAALIAYLPYGKLKHMFNVPLTYWIEEVWGLKKQPRV
ncbi:MAG: respiratory nitrate reductase subunit gamma [Desulfobacteraceae bacterium]|nr:respiratory nitrate reductase subunit gamma [Desulfobacteraceae bacterium]